MEGMVNGAIDLEIIEFCSIECELQMSGERSVSWMCQAWMYAMNMHPTRPTVDDVIALGQLVEPVVNHLGYRKVGVRVGYNVKPDWQTVPHVVESLCIADAYDALGPAEWFRQYEEIHPFRDGNGRSGAILFNWLNDTLYAPVWPPNFWQDSRRYEGHGA